MMYSIHVYTCMSSVHVCMYVYMYMCNIYRLYLSRKIPRLCECIIYVCIYTHIRQCIINTQLIWVEKHYTCMYALYTYTDIHIYIYIYICTYIHIYIYIYIYTYIHRYVHVRLDVNHACMYVFKIKNKPYLKRQRRIFMYLYI